MRLATKAYFALCVTVFSTQGYARSNSDSFPHVLALQAGSAASTSGAQVEALWSDPSFLDWDEVKLTNTPYEAMGTARATGTEPRHPRGEERSCGNIVTCVTVSVTLPKGAVITGLKREAAEAGSNSWFEDPQPNLGWCWWEAGGTTQLADGRTLVFATLKNWSHVRTRQARLRVWIK